MEKKMDYAKLIAEGKMRPIERRRLEVVARVFGEHSAAARAIADADSHPGEVRFWDLPSGRDIVIIVEKLPVVN